VTSSNAHTVARPCMVVLADLWETCAHGPSHTHCLHWLALHEQDMLGRDAHAEGTRT